MNPLKPVDSTTVFFAGKEPDEKTNEVARLRERLETSKDLIHEIRMDRNAKTAEVARLRELLNQAIEIADGLVDPFTRITGVPEQELAKLKASVALAPAPEEQNK